MPIKTLLLAYDFMDMFWLEYYLTKGSVQASRNGL